MISEAERSQAADRERRLKEITEIELKVKDAVIAQLQAEGKRLKRDIGELQTKLRIPRHHLKFLEENGALEEFVKAKMDGEYQAARQVLDKVVRGNRKGASSTITSTEDVTTELDNAHVQPQTLHPPKLLIPHSTSVSQASPRTKLHLPRHSLDMLRISNRSQCSTSSAYAKHAQNN